MTRTASNTSARAPATAELAPTAAKVLAALHRLGEATAAATAAEASLGYSTTTPKLRMLENAGLAEPVRSVDGRTLWRLTEPGRAVAGQAAAAADGAATAEAGRPTGQRPAPAPASEPDPHSRPPAGARRPTSNDLVTSALGEALEGRASTFAPDTVTGPNPDRVVDTGEDAAAADDVAEVNSRRSHGAAGIGPAVADTEGHPPAEGRPPDARPATEPAAPAAGQAAKSRAAPPETPDIGEASGEDAVAAAGAASGEDAVAAAGAAVPTTNRKRRPAGALEASVLAILQGDPTGQYTVNDLRKLVDKADEGIGYPAASAGAIANALDKLTGNGKAVVIPARYATFQAAPADG